VVSYGANGCEKIRGPAIGWDKIRADSDAKMAILKGLAPKPKEFMDLTTLRTGIRDERLE
jgi:hypothetical protein